MSKEKLGALLLLASFLGGVAATLTKTAAAVVPSALFVSLRFFIAFILVFILFRKRILTCFKRENLKPLLFLSLLMSIAFMLFNKSLALTTATNATFFYTISTLMIPFLAKWINGINFSKGLLLGLAIAMVGMYFLSTDGGSFSLNTGDCLALACAVFFALQVVYTGRFALAIDPMVVCCLQFFFVSVFTLIVSLVTKENLSFSAYGSSEWLAIFFAGILGTAALYVTQTFAQVKLKESTIGIIYAFIPVFTAGSAWFILGERLSPIGIWGGALMISGIILAGKLNIYDTPCS